MLQTMERMVIFVIVLITFITSSNAADPIWTSPSSGGSSVNVDENSATDTTIYTLVATDADGGDSLTYSIRSIEPYEDFFKITGADLLVKSGATLNAEDIALYTLTFFVTDGVARVRSGTLTVTVTDVQDESSIIASRDIRMLENQAVDFVIGSADVSPAFTSGITYSLVTANSFFTVDSSTGEIKATSTPFLTASPVIPQLLEIKAVKSTNTATATIRVYADSQPTFLSTDPSIVTATALSAGSTIFIPSANVGAGITYSITAGDTNSDFDFSTGVVKVAAGKTLDKATTASYTLSLQVEVSSVTGTMVLQVTVDEAPTFTLPLPGGTSTSSIAENSPVDTTIETLAVADTEGDSLTYSIQFINPYDPIFDVQGDKIVLSSAKLNREVQPTYTMYFTVHDASTTVKSEKLSLTITDVVDESSLFTPITTRLLHKQAADVSVYTVSFVDAFPVAGTTFSFVSDPTYFTIDASGVIKTSSTQLVYAATTLESVVFKVKADYSELSNSATVDVTVHLDTGPEYIPSTVNVDVAESSASGHTVYDASITDEDGDALTFTASITPNQDLQFDGANAVLTLIGNLDYTAVSAYTLTVTAIDSTDSLTATATINVDVKTQPVFVNPDPNTVPIHEVAEGTTGSLYVLSATDEDGDSLTYTIGSVVPASTMFEITGGTTLSLKAGQTLDYETETQYLIGVTVQDTTTPTPQSATSTLRLRLTNLNDVAPVFTNTPYEITVKEGKGAEVALLQVFSSDGDNIATTPTYQVSGNSLFTFTGDKFGTTASLTYDSGTPTILVTVEVVDASTNGNTGTATVTVTVTEATAPVFSSPVGGGESFPIAESTTIDHTIVTLLATDADGDTLTYAMPDLPVKFGFDAGTRELTTASTFDYDLPAAERSYTLKVTVTDENGTPNVVTGSVTVSVTDINDNSPVFNQPVYTATLEDGATSADFLTPTATDGDGTSPNNLIKYVLTGSPPSAFSINSASGALSVTAVAYSSSTPVFTLALEAQDLDGAVGFTTGAAEAHVAVVTVPVMTYPAASTQKDIAEDKTPSDVLLTATSTDTDGDVGTYSLVTSTTKFVMSGTNNADLKLAAGQSLDFDGSDPTTYTLEIQVIDDDSKSATGTVTLQLTDVNDNPPVFGTITYSSPLVIEQTNSAETVATVTISDADSSTDSNNVVTLEVTAGDPGSLFSVNSVSATVKEIKGTNLVYNDAPYSITLTAKDRNGAAGFQSSTSVLTINVRKVPEFLTPPAGSTGATVPVPEDSADTQTLYTLSASASSALTYSINSQTTSGLFELSGTSNTALKLASGSTLDYETTTTYVIVFHAIDASTLTGSGTLTITVTDVNDNPPVFAALSNLYTVLEKQQAESTIVTVAATDADTSTNDNNVIQFSLSAGNPNSWFSIGSSTGIITAVTNLQHSGTNILLTVLATDRNGGAGALSASTTVTVSIQKIPEFTAPPPEGVTISKPEDMAVTDVVYTVAVSSDTSVTVSINSQTPTGVFELTGSTSMDLKLVSGQSFDYEGSNKIYTVVFYAVDQTPQTASTTLTVSVTDVNDNDPIFESFSGTVSMIEGSSTAVTILELRATDADSSLQDNNVIQYSITSGDASLFAVGSSTGIVTAVNLNYATSSTHSVTVTAKDRNGASGARSADAAITVNVKTQPIWNSYPSPFNVQESAAAGSSAFSVTATDADGGTIIYSITEQVPSTPAGIFVFNSGSPSTQINVGSIGLDRDVSPAVAVVTLRLEASDGQYTATVSVTVNIEDLNDNVPQFSQTTYSVAIPETNAVGSSVINVPATDLDASAGYSTLMYSITSGNTGNLFAFASSSSSQINVAGALNFVQGSSSYTLAVQASDGTNMNTATVNITVKTAPTFTAPITPTTVTKAENISPTDVIITLTATDEDGDSLTYAFTVQPTSANSLFKLGGTGNRDLTLGAGKSLNFEGSDWPYTITFTASDTDGNVANSSPVTLSVTDINDNSPTFSGNLDVPVKTIVTVGASVGAVTATDADSSLNDNNVITYTIVSGNDAAKFNLNPSTGAITLAQTLTLSPPSYELVVKAADGGNPSRSGSVTVTVSVVQDSDPVITSPALGGVSINLSENQAVAGSVYAIVASDSDRDGLSYTIKTQTPSMRFELATNVLRLKNALDFEQETSYTLTFEVDDIDGNTANKQTSGALVINILNENEFPVFHSYYHEVNVMEWQTSAVGVIDLNAEDQDTGASGTLTYTIVAGDEDEDFNIDANTGLITTNVLGLTRHKRHYYYLAVQAVDAGTNKRADSMFVKVNVTPFNNDGDNIKISLVTISLTLVVNIILFDF